MAAIRPARLLPLAGDGLALMLFLTAVLGIERLGQLSATNRGFYVAIMLASAAAALLLLVVSSGLHLWRQWSMPRRGEMLAAALCVSYLLMPLIHHLGFSGGLFYISDADNFFSRSLAGQFAIWLSLMLLVALTTRLRERWQARWLLRSTVGGANPYTRLH
jgi:hypothetical protein